MQPSTITKLPKLVRKRLDNAGVLDHLATLAQVAEAVQIRARDRNSEHSQATDADLVRAGRQLLAGTHSALQLQFRLDDNWWLDTIMRVEDSYRLVRIKQPGPDDEA